MANTPLTKPLSFAFSYGFTEGKLHSRQMTRLLKKAGYTPARDPKQAARLAEMRTRFAELKAAAK